MSMVRSSGRAAGAAPPHAPSNIRCHLILLHKFAQTSVFRSSLHGAIAVPLDSLDFSVQRNHEKPEAVIVPKCDFFGSVACAHLILSRRNLCLVCLPFPDLSIRHRPQCHLYPLCPVDSLFHLLSESHPTIHSCISPATWRAGCASNISLDRTCDIYCIAW